MPALRFQEASMATTRRTRQQTKKVAEPIVEETISLTEDITEEVEINEVTPEVIAEEAIVEVAEEAPEVKELVIEEPKTPKSKGYQNKAIRKPQTKGKYVPAEPNGHIIHLGEEITVPGDDMGNAVVVSEDVYREVLPRNSKRSSFILLYTKGTVVPKFALKKLQ
jgi:dsDNA-specific endonuclease/ATPase MutS2